MLYNNKKYLIKIILILLAIFIIFNTKFIIVKNVNNNNQICDFYF